MGEDASTNFVKCTTDRLRPASADEEAAADLISRDDLRDLQMQTQRGSSMGAVDVAREGPLPPPEPQSPTEEAQSLRSVPSSLVATEK